jgi:hypothetical protein
MFQLPNLKTGVATKNYNCPYTYEPVHGYHYGGPAREGEVVRHLLSSTWTVGKSKIGKTKKYAI